MKLIHLNDDSQIRLLLFSRLLAVLLPLLVSTYGVALWKAGITSVESQLAIYEWIQHYQGMLALTLLWCVWPAFGMASRSQLVLLSGISIVMISWAGHEFWLDWHHEWQVQQYVADLFAVITGVKFAQWIIRPAPETDWVELLRQARDERRNRAKHWSLLRSQVWKFFRRLLTRHSSNRRNSDEE